MAACDTVEETTLLPKTPVSAQIKSWEARCQTKRSDPIVPRRLSMASRSTDSPDSPAISTISTMPPRPISPVRYNWRLENISEQRILQTGVRSLSKKYVIPRGESLAEMPARKGGPQIMQGSFLKRILLGEVELKSSVASDVIAAQGDLRHLDCDQLLCIRERTLDFATESASHNGQMSFLQIVDLHLFEKLARRCLREPMTRKASEAASRVHELRDIGFQVSVLRGAVEVMIDDVMRRNDGTEIPPDCWIMTFKESIIPGVKYALFHFDDYRLTLLHGERPDFSRHVPSGKLAVITDRSKDSKAGKRLFWLVSAYDPKKDDVYAALESAASSNNSSAIKKNLNQELEAALKHRNSM